MGMKFLNKKTWHPATFRNQERVWKAEQKHKEEEKKMAELQKQVREEREREEFRELQIRAGVMPQQERLDFLYESGLGVGKPSEAAAPSTEEYLLGKPVEEASKTETISKDFSQPGALFQKADDPASKNDAWRKLHSDPLLAIRQQEQAALAKIKENPVQMMMLKQQAADKKAQKKEEKRRAKEEQRAERKRKREERKKRRRADSSASESESESGDEQPAKPPPEKKSAPVLKEAPKEGGRNGHSREGIVNEERGFETRRRGDDRRADSQDKGRSPARLDGRGDGYRNRESERYGDRMPGRNGRGGSPRGRGEEPGRAYEGRHGRGYSPGRHRRSPEGFRNGGLHHRGGRFPPRDDRERSLERYQEGERQSRGRRSPRRDDWERSPEAPRKRQRHDSSDEEAENRRPVRSAGEERGQRGETRKGEERRRSGEERGRDVERRRDDSPRKNQEMGRVGEDRRRHDTPESDADRNGEEGKREAESGFPLETSSGRNGNERNGAAVNDEPQRSNGSEEARDVGVKKEDFSEGDERAEPPEPGRVSGRVKEEETEDSDDEPGKLRGYGLIPGRGGLQLPAKRPGDAPPVPYKKPEEPVKPPPRVRHVPGKLTEEEKARRLAEMQQDADVHEASRVHRLKRAAEKEDRDDAAAAKAAAGKSYLGGLEKSAYGLEKGGSVEDSIRRRTHFREKGPAASNANAFRR